MRYIYCNKDHLGNVRLSFTKNKYGVITTLDRNDYYPFGMSFLKTGLSAYDPMAIPYNYKFQGQELQETGFYDFGARMYMSDVGRWTQIDPLAEKYPGWNPYSYTMDNPVNLIDPTGMSAEEAYKPTPREAALMSKHVYGDKVKLEGGWRVSKRDFGINLTDKSGFKSQIYERVVDGKVTEYTYATAGTEADWGDVGADVKQPLGLSAQYSLAAKNATAISNQLGDIELTYTGHSLGGGLAALESNLTRRPAITFNAAGVGTATKFLNGMNNSDMKGWFGGFTAAFRTEGLIDAYIMTTDPLNNLQNNSSLLPDVNGKRHYITPTNAGSIYNGHSIDNILKEFGVKP